MNRSFAMATTLLIGLATVAGQVRGQSSPGPVHMPVATNASAATPASAASPLDSSMSGPGTTVAPSAPSPLASTLSAPSAQTAPGWLQPPSSPGTVPPPSPVPRAPAGDIHDIHGPISIPYQWLWPVMAVVALLAVAGLYALWRFFPRRLLIHVKTPYEIALERLEAARSLMKTDTVREYAFTVSEIIRVYIEQRFGESANRRTTQEFISDLIGQAWSPLAVHRGRLEDFLGHCDLIKFARWSATTREMELMQESARAFILETQPRKDVPEPTPGAHSPAGPQAELAQAK